MDPSELHHFMKLICRELGDAFVVDTERDVIWSRVGFGNYEPNIGIRFRMFAGFVDVNGVYPPGVSSGKSISVSMDRNPPAAARDIMRRVWQTYRANMEKYAKLEKHSIEDIEIAYRLMEYGFDIDTSGANPVAKGGKRNWLITIANGEAFITGPVPVEILIKMLQTS